MFQIWILSKRNEFFHFDKKWSNFGSSILSKNGFAKKVIFRKWILTKNLLVKIAKFSWKFVQFLILSSINCEFWKKLANDIGTGRIQNANWLKGHGILLWNQFLIWFRLSACHHFCDKAVLRSPPLLVWKLRRGQKFWIFIQDYTADRWPVCVCSAPVSFTMKIF